MFSYQTPELKTSRYLPKSPAPMAPKTAPESAVVDVPPNEEAEPDEPSVLRKPAGKLETSAKKAATPKTPKSPAKKASPKKPTPKKATSPLKTAMKAAKAKPKTAAQKAMKNVLKKPGVAKAKAKAATKAASKNAAKKRPAASSSSQPAKQAKSHPLAELCNKWQQGMTDPDADPEEGAEEEDCFEDDPETDPNAPNKRNRYVGLKFASLRKQGKIPEHILNVIDKATTRAGKTTLLNKLFKQDQQGQWIMQTQDPAFQVSTVSSDVRFGVDQENTYPRSIMVHHYYRGNEQAFLQALDDGEVFAVENENKNGPPMYSFLSATSGRRKELNKQMKLDSGPTRLNQREHAQMERSMSAVASWADWTQQASLPDQGQPAQLALTAGREDVPIAFEKLVPTLQEAKQAQEKLLKDVSKVLPSLQKHPDLRLEYKEACATLTENSNKLANILTWQEFPDGPTTKKTMDELVQSLAESTSKAYEKMEQVKAAIKARGASLKK